MSNLFSIFDPHSLLGIPLNWMAFILAPTAIPVMFWNTPSSALKFFQSASTFVCAEFRAIFQPLNAPGITAISVSLFGLIAMNNVLGLIPYIFTSTSHLTTTVSLALPLWIGHMLLGATKAPNSMLAHLLPLGTPLALMPFMVLIEIISSIIRPLTLSVRLAANMVAGHLLLTLLSSQAPSLSYPLIPALMSGLLALIILESAVATIQAYVFSVLSTLYLNEVNSKPVL